MTSSGTEAAMSALRLARAFTGREVVVKFAGAYHGHSDGLLADAGSGLATLGVPDSPGVTAAQAARDLWCPWNDREALARSRARGRGAVAEPIAANMGVVPPAGASSSSSASDPQAGSLLIFDEVITGFRFPAAAPSSLRGRPDLTCSARLSAAACRGGLRGATRGDGVAPPGMSTGRDALRKPAGRSGRASPPCAQLDAAAYERIGALTDRLAAGFVAAMWHGRVLLLDSSSC